MIAIWFPSMKIDRYTIPNTNWEAARIGGKILELIKHYIPRVLECNTSGSMTIGDVVMNNLPPPPIPNLPPITTVPQVPVTGGLPVAH